MVRDYMVLSHIRGQYRQGGPQTQAGPVQAIESDGGAGERVEVILQVRGFVAYQLLESGSRLVHRLGCAAGCVADFPEFSKPLAVGRPVAPLQSKGNGTTDGEHGCRAWEIGIELIRLHGSQ
ncbi:hypothetical protein AWV80_28385 [Cupriavidus sp. UYMU48A]|nr:hypothetical protein AWV80_28385 [Cupriavidus sp. UYMU48A]